MNHIQLAFTLYFGGSLACWLLADGILERRFQDDDPQAVALARFMVSFLWPLLLALVAKEWFKWALSVVRFYVFLARIWLFIKWKFGWRRKILLIQVVRKRKDM